MTGRDRLIVALDVPKLEDATRLVERIGDAAAFYKVGLELYLAEGTRAVEVIRRRGEVFLDLKLCDIPETVARATRTVARSGASLLTVHASGGLEMMRRAADAAHEQGMRVVAVTVLTSLDENDLRETGAAGTLEELALLRARLAARAGVDGVVASPAEAEPIRQAFPPPFLIVTPGVRLAGASQRSEDQKRVGTAAEARRRGADYVVVGRPIRDAADPAAAARALAAELDG